MTQKFEVTLTEDDPNEMDQTLRVIRDGEVVLEESDRGEPEDQSFYRDWGWVPGAIERAYAYGVEDGRGCATESDWGCDARKKLGHARGVLMTAHEDLEELLTALAPVMMACQSNGAHTLMLEIIKKVEAAVKETGQPQLCGAKEEI